MDEPNVFDLLDDRRRAAADASLNAAFRLDPERQARVQALAREMGVSNLTADAQFSTLDAERRRREAAGILQRAPRTQAFLGDPDRAATASDTLAGLAGIEAKANRRIAYFETDRGPGEAFRAKDGSIWLRAIDPNGYSAPLSAFQDIKPVYEQPGRPSAARSGDSVAPVVGPKASFGAIARDLGSLPEIAGLNFRGGVRWQGADALGGAGLPVEFTRQDARRDIARARALEAQYGVQIENRTVRGLYGGFKSFLTNTLPSLAVGIATKNPWAGAAVAGGQTEIEAYGKYRSRGAAPGEALLGSGLEGGVEVITERIPMGQFVDRLGKEGAKKFLAGFLLREVPSEQVATLAQDAVDTAIANPDKTWADYWAERPDAAYDTFLGSLVNAGIVGGANAGIRRLSDMDSGRREQALEASAAADQFNDLVADVAGNPLTQRSPDQMREFLDTVIEGEVHIPAEVVEQFLQARRGDDLDAMIDDWGIRDQLGEALAANADIVVDAATYMAKIAPVAHDAFKDDLRLGAGAMSAREAADYEATRLDWLEEASREVADQMVKEEADATPANRVFQAVYAEALDAGFTPDVARQYGSLWAARYATRAERSPELYGDALDAYTASRVKIRQDLPEDLKRRVDRLDILVNALRARRQPQTDEAVYGPSLLTFISRGGGVTDAGGELARMDAGAWHKAKRFRRKLVREEQGDGSDIDFSPERVAERAYDAGYIAEPTEAALLEAMRDELAGRMRFPADAPGKVSAARQDFGDSLDQLEEVLHRLGLNVDTATNTEIKAAVDAYQREPGGDYFEQAPGETSVMRRQWAAYRDQLARYYRDPASVRRVTLGNTPTVLRLLGAPAKPLLVHQSVLKKIGEKHGLQRSLVERLPEMLSDPVAVYRSTARDDGFVAVLEYDSENRPVVAAVIKAATGGTHNVVASVHVRDYAGWEEAQIRQGNLLYADMQRTLSGASIAEVKTLGGNPAQGPESKIFAREDLVKVAEYERSKLGLEQSADGTTPRGRIDLLSDGQRIITLFEKRDLSTLLHEGGHLWLEELREDAAAGSQSAIADLAEVEAWFAKNEIADPVEQHEAWARATEAYLMEGKAPSLGLRGAFERFKSWLLGLYRMVSRLNTPIDDNIRGVLDRLIATDMEINLARETIGGGPMFSDAAAAGMTAAEFETYARTVEKARTGAHDTLLAKVMGALKRQRTAEWREEAEELRPEATIDVDRMPDMRAINWLRANKVALARAEVVAILGDESALAMLPRGVPPLVTEKGGVHPDVLAEVAGYQTGDEMLRALMGVEAERQAMRANGDERSVRVARIDAEVARIQQERHGDPFNDGTLEREALDAIHNERHGEVLAAELRALSRRTGDRPTPYQMVRDWARKTIAGKAVRDAARTDRYLRAERKASTAAIDAAAKGDHEAAVRQKQAQVLNHLLYIEARKAGELVDKAVKLMSRYAKAKTIKGMDQDYLEQIHALLERYDFAPTTLRAADRKQSFAKWVTEKLEAGEEIVVSEEMLTDAARKSYVNMTVEELSGLYDSVRSIAHLGRLKQQLLDKREQREYEQIIDEALGQTFDLKTVRDLSVANPKKLWWAQGDAALLKVETWLDWLDKGDINGVFNRILLRPATDAADREGQLREKISKRLGELRDAVPKDQRKAWLNAYASPRLIEPRTGEPMKMQRGDLIAIALNVGNESNLDKLLRGYQWDADNVLSLLNSELTTQEWDFVQGVWDTLETLWPDIAEVERKLSGVAPERVVPREVEVPGRTLKGGYYPVVYDFERTADATKWAAREAADMFSGVSFTAGTPKGHTKLRTNYAAPISLSVARGLNGHVNKVIKRVAYGEFVLSARKFITDRRIRQMIQAKMGEEYYEQLMPWLQRQVNDQVVPSKELAFFERFARRSRVNFQMVAMGFRWTTMAAQASGLASSTAVIGERWMAKGMEEALRLGVHGAPEFVFSRSPEMEQRGRELDRDLRDAMLEFGEGAGGLDRVRQWAFAGIGFMDRYVVAMPTWLGAYHKAIHEGHEESDAIAAADKAVRTSQGSGRAKDLAAVQAPNSEFMKLFTLFYSYFNVQYQRQRDAGRAVARGDILGAARTSFWMLVAAPLAGALLTGDLPDDEEGWLEWIAAKVFFNFWAGVPVIRDVASYGERKVRGKYSEYAVTPLARVAGSVEDTLGDVIKLVTEGEPGDRWVKHAIETPGYFIGAPTGQAANTVQYLSDLIDGDQEPENVVEFVTGLLKGPQEDQER